MRRLTAISLLLFALFGSVVPLTQALTATSPHACCLRKGMRQCHEAGSNNSSEASFRDASCCRGNCHHAVTGAQWAQAELPPSLFSSVAVSRHSARSQLADPATTFLGIRSSRAPPLS
jgi:hypothetical protein